MRYPLATLLTILMAWPVSAPASEPSSELQQASLAQELEVMSLTTGAASLIREGSSEEALKLLEKRLTTSVERAQSLSSDGTRLPKGMVLPSLSGAPDRARVYAEANGLTEVATRAQSLSKTIQGSDEESYSPREPNELEPEIIGRWDGGAPERLPQPARRSAL